MTVKTVTFSGTTNGVRVKTWARPSNGFVRNVLFQHIVMVNVKNPIIIDQNYCPNHQSCPHKVLIEYKLINLYIMFPYLSLIILLIFFIGLRRKDK